MVCLVLIIGVTFLIPELAFAQIGGIGSGDLAGRMNGLTSNVINVILPAVSILGLVYSAILAATGDQAAKSRMVLIAFASIVGFLAPIIIGWLKSASGAGSF
ncbi:MAG: hypothetical protein N4A33_10850 [Bacteriovoracaceae bacterium]|jgi:predicted neutral ceramidase superfamily lipid hydrolase|nr:hypothetical protein [Bacteriovoracaceae bacterium]